jgi:menaquinone-specific isochorismate synthase
MGPGGRPRCIRARCPLVHWKEPCIFLLSGTGFAVPFLSDGGSGDGMAETKKKEEFSPVEKRLVSVSAPIDDVEPATLLRLGKGSPRGFWAREGRWIAHIGTAATVEVGSENGSQDRFSDVWGAARTIFSCTWKDPQSKVNPPSPKLFGGFSFSEEHRADDAWEGFPPAHFVLPEVELIGGEDSGVLTLRRHLVPSDNPNRCRQDLRDELSALRDSLVAVPPEPVPSDVCIPATRYETDPEAWANLVETGLEAVEGGDLSKVVMARVLTASFEGTVDPVDVVLNLWRENPGSHVFFFEPTPGNVLLGAAPETVATVSGGIFRATAVAGSIARGSDAAQQAALARDLLKSEKNRREHQVCVDDMVARLAEVSDDIQALPEPHVLTLTAIQHLETAITASLHPNETVISALKALHPTPAVCGFPRDAAFELLRTEEPFQRGWYAGPVGWFDNDGNGAFVPALRSAVGWGKEWRLFAGAGIVAGSDSSKEWAETRIKFQPVLKALSGARAEPSPDSGDGADS